MDFLLSNVEPGIETENQIINPKAISHSTAARIQALSLVEGLQALNLMEDDIAVRIAASRSGISKKTVLKYMKTARLRGYDPAISTVMKEEYVTDKPRSGRPPIVTQEVEEQILAAGNIVYLCIIIVINQLL